MAEKELVIEEAGKLLLKNACSNFRGDDFQSKHSGEVRSNHFRIHMFKNAVVSYVVCFYIITGEATVTKIEKRETYTAQII